LLFGKDQGGTAEDPSSFLAGIEFQIGVSPAF
jgi:hypothetical protein